MGGSDLAKILEQLAVDVGPGPPRHPSLTTLPPSRGSNSHRNRLLGTLAKTVWASRKLHLHYIADLDILVK